MSFFDDNEEPGAAEDKEFEQLLNRFEDFVRHGKFSFFDAQEIIELIEYYDSWMDHEMHKHAVQYGVEHYPFNSEIKLKEAELLAAQNYTVKAMEILNELEPKLSNSIDYYLIKGEIFSKMGLSQQAIKEYNKALIIEDAPKDKIITLIGTEYIFQTKYETALQYFTQALEINSENYAAIHEIYNCFVILNQYDRSIEFFSDFIEKHPFSENSWYYLARTYEEIQDYDKALDAIDYALAINEDNYSSLQKKAEILKILERYTEAIELFTKLLDYYEDNAYVITSIADCYVELEEYEKAIYFFQKALHAMDDYPAAWLGLSYALISLSQISEAIHSLDKAVTYADDDDAILYTAALLYSELDMYEEAVNVFEKALHYNYTGIDIYIPYTIALEKSGYVSKAIEILSDKIYKEMNQAPELLYALASLLLLYGYRKEGLNTLETAMQTDSTKIPLIFRFSLDFEKDLEIVHLINQYKNKDL